MRWWVDDGEIGERLLYIMVSVNSLVVQHIAARPGAVVIDSNTIDTELACCLAGHQPVAIAKTWAAHLICVFDRVTLFLVVAVLNTAAAPRASRSGTVEPRLG